MNHLHQCITDNSFDVEIKCHICKRRLKPKEAEMAWNYLKVNEW